jgi:uncharacterized membrane protein
MDQTTTKRRFPWLKLALVLSLMLNFVALGMIWSVASRAGPSGSLLRMSIAALPAPERRALRRESSTVWRAARNGGTEPKAMIAALEAEQFDADAFSATLRQAQDRLLRMSNQMHDKLLVKVSEMSIAERRAYAATLQKQMQTRKWQGEQRTGQ